MFRCAAGFEFRPRFVGELAQFVGMLTVCCNPSFDTVRFTHASLPNGRPRLTLVRSRSNSLLVSGRLTRATQSLGRCTGQSGHNSALSFRGGRRTAAGRGGQFI